MEREFRFGLDYAGLPITILSELPVHPSGGGSELVSDAYISERDEVRTKAQLARFVSRWRAVWKLPLQRDEKLGYEERVLARGRVPRKHVFKHFLRMRAQEDPGPGYKPGRIWKMAAHIMAPRALVQATLVSHHFGVPHDVALVQLYDGQRFF